MALFNFGPSGFVNAPVSKLFLISILSVNILGSIIGSRNNGSIVFGYNYISLYKLLFNPINYWRFITGPFVFSSVGEFFFGLILIYIFRLLERLWGSKKFAVFCIFSSILALSIQIILAVLFNLKVVWSGPYGIIFACLAQYIVDIPALAKFSLFSIPSQSNSWLSYLTTFSEKYVVYLLCFQLLLAYFPHSFVAGIAGLVAGFIYRLDFLYIHTKLHLLVPNFISQFCQKFIDPLLRSDPSQTQRRRRQQQVLRQTILQQQQHPDEMQGYFSDNLLGNLNQTNAAQQPNLMQFLQQMQQMQQQQPQQQMHPQQQSEEELSEQSARVTADPNSVQLLVDMGYDRQDAERALIAANNNIERAVDILLI